MQNDWYQALVVLDVPAERTKALAIEATSRLAKERLITIYEDQHLKTHVSGKFAPGPDLARISGYQDKDFADMNIGGMDVYVDSWVNDYGIVGLDQAICPSCNTEFNSHTFEQTAFLIEAFADAGKQFSEQRVLPSVTCPNCNANLPVNLWQTMPHLGFCNLAFTFWNWPPFDGWSLNIQDIISETLRYEVVLTYGRL